MNRPKLWLYLALLLCVGAANLIGLSRWLTHRAIAQIDRELAPAVAQVDARSQLLAMEAASIADAVARDPAVLQGLSAESEGKTAAVAQSAAQGARGPSVDPSRPLLLATAGHGWRSYAVSGAPVQSGPQLDSLVSGASVDGARREGYAVVGDALYYLVATPAGRGAAIAVGVPVNVAWLAQLRATTGADVTLLLDQRPPRGSLGARESEEIGNAVRGATGPVDVGALPAQPLFGPGTSLARVPLLFASAPAYRAIPVALRGLPGSTLVLSQPTSALIAPVVSYGWVTLAGLVVLLLAGIGTALSITNERELIVPKDLLAAADRITRRDFTARAPVMAGTLGTVAAALNCAAEAARSAAAGAAQAEAPSAPAAAEAMPPAGAGEAASDDPFARFATPPEPAATPAASAGPEQAKAPTDGSLPAYAETSALDAAAAPESASAEEATAEPAPTPHEESIPAQDAPPATEPEPAQDAGAPHEPAEASLAAFLGAGPDAPAAQESTQESAFPWPPAPEAAPAEEGPPAPSLDVGEGAASAAAEALSGTQSYTAEPAEQLAAAAQELEVAPPLAPGALLSAFGAPAGNGALAPEAELAGAVPQEPVGASAEAAPEPPSPPEPAAPQTRPAEEPLAPAAFLPPPEPQPAPALDGDEDHWRITYGEFLKVREQCGESTQGLPYERFRQKLQKNRDQLVAKYGCRTVRFQVYVKDGRAALKASPVR